MSAGWQREDQADVAVDKILDAAEKAFIEVGVAATGMAKVAEFASCSRGTLYRYFKNRRELHMAYIHRSASTIVLRVREKLTGIDDPRQQLVEGILFAVQDVRERPGTAAWFASGVSGATAQLSRSSEVIEAFTYAFASKLFENSENDPESRMSARWIVRVVVSLLVMPAESPEEERTIVERYATPGILQTPN